MSPDGASTHPVDTEAIQRQTLRTLICGVVPAGAAMTSAYSASAVLGEELTGSETLGALAAACLTVGSALATLPLARLMAVRGRRPGIVAGYTTAVFGALIAASAAVTGFYALLPLGMLGVGAGNAANLAARYAAADLAPEEGRARTIGNLVWSSTIGAVLGPTIGLGPARHLGGILGGGELVGPYLVAAVLFTIAGLVVYRWLRPDPLIVVGGTEFDTGSRVPFRVAFRSLAASRPGRLAVGSMVAGQVVMVAVMTMTPLHMKDGGHQLELIGFVISLHIIGMYALSPVVGWLTDRIGPRPVIAVGGIMLIVGSEFASHTDPEHSTGVFTGLFLIGLGWSFGLVASSSLIATTFQGLQRVRVQGLADLMMTASGGLAGLGSGLVVSLTDFRTLSHYSGILGLYPTAAVLIVALTGRRTGAYQA